MKGRKRAEQAENEKQEERTKLRERMRIFTVMSIQLVFVVCYSFHFVSEMRTKTDHIKII